MLCEPSKIGFFSYREIAAALGEIQWSLRVRGLVPLEYEELKKAWSAKSPKKEEKWNDLNKSISTDQVNTIQEFLKEAQRRPMTQRNVYWKPTGKFACYAAEASMNNHHRLEAEVTAQIAFVNTNTLSHKSAWTWIKKDLPHLYIGDAEWEVSVLCIEDALENDETVEMIISAADSMCALGTGPVQRESARILLRRVRAALEGKSTRICCVYIRTDHNIADVPSRIKEEGEDSSWKVGEAKFVTE